MKNILNFLKSLSENNSREWFEKNKDQYEMVKEEQAKLVDNILKRITSIEPEFDRLKPSDCMFRIYRDIRFSTDKTPYKTHIGLYFERDGKKSSRPGYYVHIEPDNKSMVAGGLWMPDASALKKVRQEIDYNGDKLMDILNQSDFKKSYGGLSKESMLKKMPKGYLTDHPYIDLLKLKSYTASHGISDNLLMEENFADYVVDTLTKLKPVNDFLKEAIES